MTEVGFRPLTAEDAEACVELWLRALLERDGAPAAPGTARLMRRRFEQRDPRSTAAVRDGRVVGIAVLLQDDEADGALHLQYLAVEPGEHGRGIGGALLGEVLRTLDGRRASLRVRTGNARAIDLYERAGFTHG